MAAGSVHPSWMPRPLGPFSLRDFNDHVLQYSIIPRPGVGSFLHFYHADLGPRNIMVWGDGDVLGILDWESAGFYPRGWVVLKPLLSA